MMFSDQSAISAHYDTVHNAVKEKLHECDVCGKKLATAKSVKYHKAHAHGIGEVRSYSCDVCARVFRDKSNLSKHLKNVHKSQ